MRKVFIYILSAVQILCLSCHSVSAPEEKVVQKDIVEKKEHIDEHIENDIPKLVQFAAGNKGKINDSIQLSLLNITGHYYSSSENKPLWSDDGKWKPYTQAFVNFIEKGLSYGLFPADYHFKPIINIQHRLNTDSTESKNAVLWGTADILMTDAFFGICHDLRVGRLPNDSLSVNKDSLLTDTFYADLLNQFVGTGDIDTIVHFLEPKHPGYQNLKSGLASFLDSVEFSPATYVNFPAEDSIKMYKQLQKRFVELHLIKSDSILIDTTRWKHYIANYQFSKKLKVTGALDISTVNRINATSWERFKQIAVTLDKYKQLPDTMPLAYAIVNIPTFRLKVFDSDSIAFESRVVVGAPDTRTPELSSEVSNFITYPQWTVPMSIIFKEMLPKIQEDVEYLERQNLMVVDRYDSVMDPYLIDWSKLDKNHFPYIIKQREGDDNSLGVIKFNFRNKYSVYLHDTNARYMFQRSARALSHGCVRVQQWRKFANYLIRNDTLQYNQDSLISWLDRKEKKVVQGFQRVPIYIRYYTCEGVKNRVVFYDDVYGTDKYLREKYFSDKTIINNIP